MKILNALDKWLAKVMVFITALLTAAIMIVVNIQVISRYFFNFSLGPLSDTPPYLMIFTIWFGAILAARSEDHIKIELLDLFIKSRKALAIVEVIILVVSTAAMSFFTYYAVLYVQNAHFYGGTDPSLKIPYWYLYSIIPFSGGFMSLYYLVNTIKKIKGVVKSCRLF